MSGLALQWKIQGTVKINTYLVSQNKVSALITKPPVTVVRKGWMGASVKGEISFSEKFQEILSFTICFFTGI